MKMFAKDKDIVNAIQWTGDNKDEISAFLATLNIRCHLLFDESDNTLAIIKGNIKKPYECLWILLSVGDYVAHPTNHRTKLFEVSQSGFENAGYTEVFVCEQPPISENSQHLEYNYILQKREVGMSQYTEHTRTMSLKSAITLLKRIRTKMNMYKICVVDNLHPETFIELVVYFYIDGVWKCKFNMEQLFDIN